MRMRPKYYLNDFFNLNTISFTKKKEGTCKNPKKQRISRKELRVFKNEPMNAENKIDIIFLGFFPKKN